MKNDYTSYISFWLTKEEKDNLKYLARVKGLNVSEYLRNHIKCAIKKINLHKRSYVNCT